MSGFGRTPPRSDWLKESNKLECPFICFDVEEFYASISEHLLDRALDLALLHTLMTAQDRRTIRHARESLLFRDGQACTENHGQAWRLSASIK